MITGEVGAVSLLPCCRGWMPAVPAGNLQAGAGRRGRKTGGSRDIPGPDILQLEVRLADILQHLQLRAGRAGSWERWRSDPRAGRSVPRWEVLLEVLTAGRSDLRSSGGSWEEPRLEDWRERRLEDLRGNSRLMLEDLMEAGRSHCWRMEGLMEAERSHCWRMEGHSYQPDLQSEGDDSSCWLADLQQSPGSWREDSWRLEDNWRLEEPRLEAGPGWLEDIPGTAGAAGPTRSSTLRTGRTSGGSSLGSPGGNNGGQNYVKRFTS